MAYEEDIGKPCPHGDTYGSCGSSMCYVWTEDDLNDGDEQMTQFHAVILDECGQEFGVTVNARTRSEAYDKVRESYPESGGILQMESPQDTQDREHAMYARLQAEYDDDMDYSDYG